MNSRAPGPLAVGRVKIFGRHRGEVNSSAFSPDGQRLLTASEDGCVYGWETQSGRLLWRLTGHAGPVKFCRFSPDGRLFATTSHDCTIRLWDVAEAKCLSVLKGHQRSVETVSFSPDGKQLASGGWDRRVMLWEVQVCGRVARAGPGTQRRHTPPQTVAQKGPPGLDCPLPSRPLASPQTVSPHYPGSPQGGPYVTHLRPRIWRRKTSGLPSKSKAQDSLLQSGQMLRHLGGHRDSIQSSDFAPSSDSLATGSWDSTICIWDLRMGTPVTFHQELEGHSGNISCLCYSASGLLVSWVALGSRLAPCGSRPMGLQLSAVQASGSWDKTIHIWKPSTRSLLVQLKGHVTWVKSIAFSPDGSQLASAGYSHMVKVWDCNTGKCIQTLKCLELLTRQDAKSTARSNHPEPLGYNITMVLRSQARLSLPRAHATWQNELMKGQ
ncbi:hypothetical protein GH733_011242 [Mirounga leonina]|nr:hypothetical protein GH733_011242 [Mirounga leonina]